MPAQTGRSGPCAWVGFAALALPFLTHCKLVILVEPFPPWLTGHASSQPTARVDKERFLRAVNRASIVASLTRGPTELRVLIGFLVDAGLLAIQKLELRSQHLRDGASHAVDSQGFWLRPEGCWRSWAEGRTDSLSRADKPDGGL